MIFQLLTMLERQEIWTHQGHNKMKKKKESKSKVITLYSNEKSNNPAVDQRSSTFTLLVFNQACKTCKCVAVLASFIHSSLQHTPS